MTPRVGVVTIAHGRHHHLERQHRSLALGDRLPDEYVVVAMGDPEIGARHLDGLTRHVVRIEGGPPRLPLAAARNAGVRALRASGIDVAVLLDVDCLAGRGLVAGYAAAVDVDPAVVWSGPVTYLGPHPGGGHPLASLESLDHPHPARPAPEPGCLVREVRAELFWSLSFALTTSAWDKIGGFCEDYRGYGAEDTDFARVAQAAGLGFGWVGSARAYHQHHPVSSPPVEHLDDLLRNGALFHRRWGEWPMSGWFEALADRGLVRRAGAGWVRTARAPQAPESTAVDGTASSL